MQGKRFSKRFHKQDGQGLVEYGLVLILVVIVVMFIAPKVIGWFQKDDSQDEVPPQSTPEMMMGEPSLDIVELGINAEIIDTETIPLFNCNNPSEYQLDVERSRQIEHKISTEGQFEAGLNHIVIARSGVGQPNNVEKAVRKI